MNFTIPHTLVYTFMDGLGRVHRIEAHDEIEAITKVNMLPDVARIGDWLDDTDLLDVESA